MELLEKEDSRSVHEYATEAYLNYSMYVIQERALPHVGDGLKPVHRRIVFSMSQLGLNSAAKHKKAARTVGDVLGKYHPHGDSACYEAMVLMSQDFSVLNPLVDGQGNWGSVDDPKSFAAMRYTEAKLTKYSEVLLSEIKQGTVDFRPNFDGSLQEPVFLPAQLPNILLNGSEGIAVGISTNIPSHNTQEVVDACIAKFKNANITDEQLMDIISGPDYPTGAEIITPKAAIVEAYKKGRGKVTVRAKYKYSDGVITITELPFQVYIPKVLEEISTLVEEKKFSLIQEIKDQGTQDEPVCIELVLKSKKTDPEMVMNHLFANTQLQVTRSINLTMIGLDGKPETKAIGKIISEWTAFRQETFERKKKFRLKKVEDRLHILEGLLIAYSILDEVIEIIRSEDNPKAVMMERIGLTDIQAEAILEMKLRSLAKLEEFKLKEEFDSLESERSDIKDLLASDKAVKNAVIKELRDISKLHLKERKTQIVERSEAKSMDESDLIPSFPVTVILSKKGWIRSAKGHGLDLSKLNYKAGDQYSLHVEMKNNEMLVVATESGRYFSLPVFDLPSAKTVGEPITAKLSIKHGDKISNVFKLTPDSQLLLSTKNGYGFVINSNDLVTKNKTGKDVHNISSGDESLQPIDVSAANRVAILTQQGRLLIIEKESINTLSKGKGVKLINIPKGDLESGTDGVKEVFSFDNDIYLKFKSGRKVINIEGEEAEKYFGARASRGRFVDSTKKGDVRRI